MSAVYVSDATSSKAIINASFDHTYYNGGNGFYEVDLNIGGGDVVFTTYAPDYDSQTNDYRFTSGIVSLQRSDHGSGSGGSCF